MDIVRAARKSKGIVKCRFYRATISRAFRRASTRVNLAFPNFSADVLRRPFLRNSVRDFRGGLHKPESRDAFDGSLITRASRLPRRFRAFFGDSSRHGRSLRRIAVKLPLPRTFPSTRTTGRRIDSERRRDAFNGEYAS